MITVSSRRSTTGGTPPWTPSPRRQPIHRTEPSFARSGSLGSHAPADRRRWLILGVLCASVLVVVLDGTIVNVALPTLATQLGASTSQLQWIVDAYVLVFAGLLMAAGSFGDRVGRKWVLMGGLGLFATFSALGATAGSANALIALAGGDGRRRGADVPGHPGDPRQRLHRRQGARRRHRRVGGDRRPRRRPRPGHRRLVARALLVGLGPDDQRAGRRRRPRADRARSCPTPRTRRSSASTRSARSCRSPPSCTLVWAVIEGPVHGWASTDVDRRLHPGRRPARRRSSPGSATPTTRCSTSRCSPTCASPPARSSVTFAFFALMGFVFLVTQYFQFVRGLQHARRRRPHRPVRHLHRLDRPPVGQARRAHRHQAGRDRRPRVDGRRVRRLRRHRRRARRTG